MRVANWLLRRFGVDESVHGDLAEERAAGRSFVWLARQTAGAIAAQVARDLWRHPVLAMRAIGSGWFVLLSGWIFLRWAQPSDGIVTWHTIFPYLLVFMIFVWPVVTGWTVARMHLAQQSAMLLAYAASFALWGTCFFAKNYDAIRRSVVHRQFAFFVSVLSIVLIGTLVGGFLQRSKA